MPSRTRSRSRSKSTTSSSLRGMNACMKTCTVYKNTNIEDCCEQDTSQTNDARHFIMWPTARHSTTAPNCVLDPINSSPLYGSTAACNQKKFFNPEWQPSSSATNIVEPLQLHWSAAYVPGGLKGTREEEQSQLWSTRRVRIIKDKITRWTWCGQFNSAHHMMYFLPIMMTIMYKQSKVMLNQKTAAEAHCISHMCTVTSGTIMSNHHQKTPSTPAFLFVGWMQCTMRCSGRCRQSIPGSCSDH